MTDDLEKALRNALRRQPPGEDFAGRVISQLDCAASPARRSARFEPLRRGLRTRWLPVALAAGIVAAVALVQVRQQALDTARANRARAQLLQALSIASANINIVRAAVAREEHPDS